MECIYSLYVSQSLAYDAMKGSEDRERHEGRRRNWMEGKNEEVRTT